MIIGTVPDTVHIDLAMVETRDIILDCRGTLVIPRDSFWGWRVTVITMGHDIRGGISAGFPEPSVDRPVIIGERAWICSGAMLYGCVIGEGAVVSFGSVVRAQEVKPYTMVAGNPARVIARWNGTAWDYLQDKWQVLGDVTWGANEAI